MLNHDLVSSDTVRRSNLHNASSQRNNYIKPPVMKRLQGKINHRQPKLKETTLVEPPTLGSFMSRSSQYAWESPLYTSGGVRLLFCLPFICMYNQAPKVAYKIDFGDTRQIAMHI